MFQGAHGLSLKEAGLLITPLALCITLEAIVNGRIVARIANPNRRPSMGFALLLVLRVGLAAAGRHASHGLLLALMFSGGLGFGFIFMNLTLFTRTLAERAHLGIATLLRVSLLFSVAASIGCSPHTARVNWATPFRDPRVLLDAQTRMAPRAGCRLLADAWPARRRPAHRRTFDEMNTAGRRMRFFTASRRRPCPEASSPVLSR